MTPFYPAGQCRRCGWDYNLHPLDAEGVDVGRCPTEAESALLSKHPAWADLMILVREFPVEADSTV